MTNVHAYRHMRPKQPGSRPKQPGLRLGWLGLRPGLGPGWMAQRGVRMDGQKISPFCRTSSHIGAAALLPKGRSRAIKRSRAREPLAILCLWATGFLSIFISRLVMRFEWN